MASYRNVGLNVLWICGGVAVGAAGTVPGWAVIFLFLTLDLAHIPVTTDNERTTGAGQRVLLASEARR